MDRTDVWMDSGDTICPPPPIENGGGIKNTWIPPLIWIYMYVQCCYQVVKLAFFNLQDKYGNVL